MPPRTDSHRISRSDTELAAEEETSIITSSTPLVMVPSTLPASVLRCRPNVTVAKDPSTQSIDRMTTFTVEPAVAANALPDWRNQCRPYGPNTQTLRAGDVATEPSLHVT